MPQHLAAAGPWTLVENAGELPNLDGVTEVYADIESISGDPKRPAGLPYHGDRCVGISLTLDDRDHGWYIPLRHADHNAELFSPAASNLPHDQAVRFLNDLVHRRRWINHNIKFDAHFFGQEGVDVDTTTLVDSLTYAKLVDAQKRSKAGGYGLKPLMEAWFGQDPDEQDEVRAFLKRQKSKDYGDVDPLVLGEYAVSDVRSNRRLWRHIESNRYEGDERVWQIEQDLTRTLFDMERQGLRVCEETLTTERESSQTTINEMEERIADMGLGVEPGSAAALQTYLLKDRGLPVVARTDSGAPSINALAIGLYLDMPDVQDDRELRQFLEALLIYREHSQFVNLYCNGWMPYIDPTWTMHANFNQYVATGRMSCLSPNLQQLNKRAKQLIVPRPGMAFLSRDYSQIEYRIICALCQEQAAIDAYNNDPNTDFHTFVAEMCGIERSPAKSVNFGIAFGMGEGGVVKQLSKLLGGADANSRAKGVYDGYHTRFPRIKHTSKRVQNIVRGRAGWEDGGWGYVRTYYGRRRALRYVSWNAQRDKRFGDGVYDGTHKAFNTTVQGTAADIAKAQLVKVAANPMLRDAGVVPVCIVHDEILCEGPIEAVSDPRIQAEFERTMVDIDIELGVPLYVEGGWSAERWSNA